MQIATVGTFIEPTRNENITVGTTSLTISDARTEKNKRKVIHLKNISADTTTVITVNFGFGIAAVNKGVILNNGEAVSDTSEQGYEAYQGMILAVASAAGGTLAIFER